MRQKKLKFSYKEQKEFDTIEDDIAALEQKIADLDTQMAACGSDYVKLQDLTSEQDAAKTALDEKMERWMYLTDLAEKIAAQEKCIPDRTREHPGLGCSLSHGVLLCKMI